MGGELGMRNSGSVRLPSATRLNANSNDSCDETIRYFSHNENTKATRPAHVAWFSGTWLGRVAGGERVCAASAFERRPGRLVCRVWEPLARGYLSWRGIMVGILVERSESG